LAINKRKILEAAQKFLQKGSLDKALKEYQSLLQADPRDSNSRLKLGDIHLKLGQKDEAISAYLKVADQFMKDGFDAKAVALYKQITKIDSNRSDVQVPLAELYQRLGLTSEAMAALQTAADAYHREGRKREALELLRKMATLDPTNTTSRMKIAELLRQAGLKDEAIAEYEEVAIELTKHDDTDGLIQVHERVLELDPARVPALIGLSRALVAKGQPDRAEGFAKRATELKPDATEGFELLAEAYRAMGRMDAMEPVYRRLADLHRSHGDEDRAREILQRFVSASPLEKGADDSGLAGAGRSGSDSNVETLDDTTAPGAAFGDSFDVAQEGDDAAFFEAAAPVQGPPTPEPDLEQVLAEASVYLRYGKHDRAIQGLEAVLNRDPENRAALEKLGEALSIGGDAARAVATWAEAAKLARTAGDAAGYSVLCDRIEALTPGAAALRGLGPIEPEPTPLPVTAEGAAPDRSADDPFLDVEVDLHGPEGALGDAASPTSVTEDLEIDVDTELPVAIESDPAGDTVARAAADFDFGDPDAVDRETAEPQATALGEGAASAEAASDESADADGDADGESGGSDGSSTTPQQIVEELEEAEFYFHQGLHEEAGAVYKRVLGTAPNHPQALLRLGEIAAARGEDPAAPATSEPVLMAAPEIAHTQPVLKVEVAPRVVPAPAAPPPAPVRAVTPIGASPEETDPGLSEHLSGWADELSPGDDAPLALGDTDPDLTEAPGDDAAPVGGDAEPPEAAFDLAAELSEVLADDDRRGPSGPQSGVVDDGFAAVFREFKRGVQRTVSEGDYETHYDLGIAYREMGLLEDAVGEFRLAMDSSKRRLDSLHMLGLCALDLKRPQDAVAHLEQALALPGVPDGQLTALRFDLGRAFVEHGDMARARSAFEAVAAADPDFQDVAERIAALQLPEPEPEPDDTDDASGVLDALGHDEGTSGAEAESEEAPTETFESFDDLIAEAESEFRSDSRANAPRDSDVDAADVEEAGLEEAEPEDYADGGAEATAEAARAGTTGAVTPAPPEPQGPSVPPVPPVPPKRRKISFI
jgi:tetratricopeptide (TPR) repeat protein